MPRTEQILITMPDAELTAWLRETAKKQERNISATIRLLLKLGRRQLEAGVPLIEGTEP